MDIDDSSSSSSSSSDDYIVGGSSSFKGTPTFDMLRHRKHDHSKSSKHSKNTFGRASNEDVSLFGSRASSSSSSSSSVYKSSSRHSSTSSSSTGTSLRYQPVDPFDSVFSDSHSSSSSFESFSPYYDMHNTTCSSSKRSLFASNNDYATISRSLFRSSKSSSNSNHKSKKSSTSSSACFDNNSTNAFSSKAAGRRALNSSSDLDTALFPSGLSNRYSSSSSLSSSSSSSSLTSNSKFAVQHLHSYHCDDKQRWNFDFDHGKPADTHNYNNSSRYQWAPSDHKTTHKL